MGSGARHSYKTLEDKVRFHNKRAKYHLERAAEWERILADVQRLQRLEQAPIAEVPKLIRSRQTALGRSRNDLAREILAEFSKTGITPAEVRERANEHGFSIPTNYPYKLFRVMRTAGKLRKDEEGRYYLIESK
jgi:hypothetical protein